MIPPKEFTPIAKKYNPDLLNEWLDAFSKQNSYALFFSLKDELLKAENHPEWFLRLKNLTKKLNISLWNEFIDFCLGEAQKLNYKDFSIDFSGCTFKNEEECNFSGITLLNINFYKAIFKDKADFQIAIFKEEANFEKAIFEKAIFKDGADFRKATFENEIHFGIKKFRNINFRSTTFNSKIDFQNKEFVNTSFEEAVFKKTTNFENATFEDSANFVNATFENEANFGNTTFEDKANFENANFENEINFGIKKFKNINFKNTIFNSKIDFQNKEFVNTSFEEAVFKKTTNFEKATFEDSANFENATFEAEADFGNTTFEAEADFGKATFEDKANFRNTAFEDEADFGKSTFEDKANFENTIFEDKANFGDTAFKDKANFGDTAFKDKANFGNTIFEDEANFGDTAFKDKANFGNTIFEDGAIFEKATFENEANFESAKFEDLTNFQGVKFKGEAIFKETLFETAFDKKIDFSKAIFEGVTYFTFPTKASNPTTDIYAELSFENATFEKETTFHRRKFFGDTSFIGAKFHFPPAFSPGEEYNPHLLNFTRTKLILSEPPQTLSLRETDIKKENKKIDSKPLTRVRNLRKLAGQIKEHDFERDLFILERIMNSRINGSKCLQQALIALYWISSNYGRSALIPFLWWVGFILGLSIFLSCVSKFHFWDALTVSATNAIPFVNRFSEKTQSIFDKYFGMEEIPNCFFWISTIHSLFSIVMIFLFSLAIRNYFRIK